MPIVADWPSLEIAREQLTYCREEITLGARAMRANPAPALADVHLMCDAVLEYFSAQKQVEAAEVTERERPSERAESTLEALQAYRDLRDGTSR